MRPWTASLPLALVTALTGFVGLSACPGSGSHPNNPTPATPDAGPVTSGDDPDATPVATGGMSLADSGIVPDWLDRNADPCDDFFEYACGGFLETAVIPPDRSSWSAIQVVVQDNELFLKDVLEKAAADAGGDPVAEKIGDYYASCTDEEAIELAGTKPLDPLLADIATVKDAKSAAKVVTSLHTIGIFPFFGIGPIQDFADATQVITGLDQAGLGLPDRDYYVKNEGNMKEVRTAYHDHMGRMFALLGWKPTQVKTAVADVFRIETALAKIQQEEVFRRDPHNVYHRVDRKGLDKAAKGFPWADYFQTLGLADATKITVNDPKYFAGVAKIMKKEKATALRNYLTWMVLTASAEHLTKAFVDENLAMEKVLTGVQQLPPRWRVCVQQVDQNLGELLGQSYVKARFSQQAKDAAVDMTNAVVAAMNAELTTLPWMDDATREAAKVKLTKMAYLVGFPDKWKEYDFPVSRTDYAGNVQASSKHEVARLLAKIGKPVDRFDWGMTPPTVNAYYDPTLNEVALPAGQLQPPFFGATFHPAINVGAIGGGTIGHEMTHGFDDEGSQFDAEGNLRDWWSKSTKEQFETATQCVADQFSKYEAVPGVFLNGKLTAGENIADIGGVKIGYQAYQQWRTEQSKPPAKTVDGFTDDQLYFLGYGQSWCAKVTPQSAETRAHTDPHSPPRYRVNGVIVDQPGFGEAFHCKVGTKMNPGNACSVW
jgi:predicted metalloendopeptidase